MLDFIILNVFVLAEWPSMQIFITTNVTNDVTGLTIFICKWEIFFGKFIIALLIGICSFPIWKVSSIRYIWKFGRGRVHPHTFDKSEMFSDDRWINKICMRNISRQWQHIFTQFIRYTNTNRLTLIYSEMASTSISRMNHCFVAMWRIGCNLIGDRVPYSLGSAPL